jgi:hypothetical protein
MRAGIVAIFFFAALLALGHYVAAPFFCRGELALPSLDPRALCGADFHLNRSGSVLLYFGSIAAALLFGVIAGVLPGRNKSAAKEKPDATPAETFEQIVASEEKKQSATPVVAHPSALAAAPAAATAEASATAPAAAATPPANAATAASTPAAPVEEAGPSRSTAEAAQAAIESAIIPPSVPQKTESAATPASPPAPSPETVAMTEAITVGLSVTKTAARGPYDGTNEELLERFRELKKQEGVNSIAQAQRLLDESTLSALSKGIDPKQHLSQIAHLVLADDPDLKSGVVRGVVVHVAARLKELGVVQKIPSPTKGAA